MSPSSHPAHRASRRARRPTTRSLTRPVVRLAARTDRIAAGIAPWIADDGAGAPSAASSAARACTNAPQPAAHHGSSPAASSAPTIPVSTSPEPAVAAHDVVDGCTSVRPSGSATTVALPLSSTVTWSAAAARRAAAIRSGPTSPATRANSRSCGVITTGRPATARAQVACGPSSVTPSASTHTGTSRSSTAASSARPAVVGPDPGPDRPRLGAPGVGDVVGGDDLGPAGADRVRGRPRVAHHPAGREHGGARGEHGRARVGRRTGRDAGDALGVLVVGRAGHRPARRHVRARPRTTACGSGSSGPSPMSTRCTGPQRCAASTCTGLQRAEGDGRGGGDGGPVDGPGVGVDAAGRVDGQHRDPGALRDGDELGRGGAQRPAAGEADDAVEHEVRARHRGGCRRDPAATTRPPARRSAARPSAWARCGSAARR